MEVKAVSGNGDDDSCDVGGVRLTHPDRIMFPRQGATKREIAHYYLDRANDVLRFLKNRPLSLVRCPQGRQDQCFYQKHHSSAVPEHIGRVDVKEKAGTTSPYLVIKSAKGLIAATQISALELHIWGARADNLERPDRLVFDLDPDTSLGFDRVRDAAFEFRTLLAAADLVSFALLTGGKGIHVVVPIERRREWPDITTFAKGLARMVADVSPGSYVTEASKAKRKGKIFIDWLRNQRGATAIAPYSLRARDGAPVATPVTWQELETIERADRYNLDNIGNRMEALGADPWQDYGRIRQSITNDHLRFVTNG